MKRSIEQLDLGGRRVFVRADLNAPLDGGAVSDDTRLTAVLPTLTHVLDHGGSVVLAWFDHTSWPLIRMRALS